MSYTVGLEVAGREVTAIAGTAGVVAFPVDVGPMREGALGLAQTILAGLPDGSASYIRNTLTRDRSYAFVKYGDVTYEADASGEPVELAGHAPRVTVSILEVATDGSGRPVMMLEGDAAALGSQLSAQGSATLTATTQALASSPRAA